MRTRIRTLILTAAAAVGVIAGRRAAESGWRAVRHQPPPGFDDAHDDTGLRDLLLWGAVLITATTVARRLGVAAAERALDEID